MFSEHQYCFAGHENHQDCVTVHTRGSLSDLVLCVQVSACITFHILELQHVPVSCLWSSTESESLSCATAAVMPPKRCISSLFLSLLKDRFRRAAEAV